MKKSLLLFIFTLLALQGFKAQVAFCSLGAEWKYYFYTFDYPYHAIYSMRYTGDSIVGTETVKVITYRSFFNRQGVSPCSHKILIRQRGDTIFMRNCNTVDRWQILYNFAATAGQSWTTSVKDTGGSYSYPLITHTIVVNAVTTVTINGMPLKKLFVSYCHDPGNGPTCGSTTITERIGCGAYLFNYVAPPPPFTDYDNLQEPLCYQDDILGTVNFVANGCNYYTGFKENQIFSEGLRIYPQPAGAAVNIQVDAALYAEGELNAVFYDLYGREAKRVRLETANSSPELKGLADGLYVLQISDAQGKPLYQSKFLKQE